MRGLCAAGVASAAHAHPTTFAFAVSSEVAPNNGGAAAPPLSLTFTVDGAVSFDANSGFASDSHGIPPVVQVAYPFPAALTSFDLNAGGTSVTLADFVSPGEFGIPVWTFDLTADPASGAASLSLFFLNNTDMFEFYGPPSGSSNPAALGTAAPGTIDFGTDYYETHLPAQYTGMLVASPADAPEPASLWLLVAGLGLFGLICTPRSAYCSGRVASRGARF